MATAGSISFGPFRYDPEQGLFRNGVEVHVTPKSLALLDQLVQHPSRVVSKAELFDTVWAGRVVSDSALSTCIRELRQALGDEASEPIYIQTVHARGFRFCAPVAAIAPPESHSAWQSRQPAVVVLPFECIGGDERAREFSHGLTHDVITQVARTRTTLVIARGTAFQLESRTPEVRRLGETLGVRYVVQGALQLRGRHLLLTVGLADSETGMELWSDRFARPLDDWMAIQEELSELIVASVESGVQREEILRASLMPSEDLHAWSAYHRGLGLMYRFKASDCDEAEHWFRRSIELEPAVPRPWAGLSFLDFQRAFLSFDNDRPARIQRALDHAQRAIDIDPRDPMGHWAHSRALLMQGDLEASKSAVEQATALNPSYAIAQYSLGWVGLQLGDNALCDDRIDFARRLSPYDPLKFAMLGVMGLNRALSGHAEDAAALAKRAVRQKNAHFLQVGYSAVTLALCKQLDDAAPLLQRIRAVSPGWDAADFLAVFKFRRPRDERRIRKAFHELNHHAT